MVRRLWLMKIVPVAAACLLWWGGVGCAQESGTVPRLQGTYLQLTAVHGEWPRERWVELFGYLKRLRLSQLIIQWTVYDDLAFFPSGTFRQVANPPLETILTLADEAKMQVLVGLGHDSAYWDRIRRQPKLVEVYCQRLRLRAEQAARELLPLVRAHPSVQGWYLPEEVDDVNWQTEEARQVLFEHLKLLGDALKKLTPEAPLAISGFANGRLDPQSYARFWNDLLAAAPVDVVLFQDGIGVEKLTLRDLPLYLAAVQQAATARSRRLEVVVELFRQESAQPFKASPASWDRLHRQLLASGAPGRALVGFSVPEYLTPLGGPEAARLYGAYLEQVASPAGVRAEPPRQ